MKTITSTLLAFLAFIVIFTATAVAQGATTPPDAGWLDLLRPVYDSFASGHYLAAGIAALMAAVMLVRKYAPEKWGIKKFLSSSPGAVLLTLFTAFTTSLFVQAQESGFSWAMFKTAGLIAAGAAGVYSMIKALLVEPFLRPWAAKATGVLKSVLDAALYFFDRPSQIAVAENAGNKAVEAKPAKGITGITGNITELK